MSNLVVIGMQWGDEGKGKIVDLLCPAFDVVARFQGGANAGHTVRFGDRHFALHLIPSGILHPDLRCVAGNGMVLDLEGLFDELEGLAKEGIVATGRLFVSDPRGTSPTSSLSSTATPSAVARATTSSNTRRTGVTV